MQRSIAERNVITCEAKIRALSFAGDWVQRRKQHLSRFVLMTHKADSLLLTGNVFKDLLDFWSICCLRMSWSGRFETLPREVRLRGHLGRIRTGRH